MNVTSTARGECGAEAVLACEDHEEAQTFVQVCGGS